MNLFSHAQNQIMSPVAMPYLGAISERKFFNCSMFDKAGFDKAVFDKPGRTNRSNTPVSPKTESSQPSLAGGRDSRAAKDEVPERVRSMDWSKTAIGPIETWPPSLMNAVELSFNANHPIAIFWGPDCVLLYNEAWRSIAGDRDLRFLGQRLVEACPELWQILGPQIQAVRETAQGCSYKDQLLPAHRFGYNEECYFSYSLNPIKASDGTVEGVFSIVEETTGSVVETRRQELLRELESKTAAAKSPEEACALAAAAIATDPADVPFALVYLVDWERQRALLSGSAGIRPDSPALLQVADLADARGLSTSWPIAEVAEAGIALRITDLSARFGVDFDSPWREVLREALVLPVIGDTPAERVVGVLVAGVSPRRALDDGYVDFYYSVCEQLASAMRSARGNQEEQRRSARLEEQLRNSHKMEEAGRLAAGAAHDLNNLLTMIYGHSDLLSEQVRNDQMREDVAMISSACERAMSLTKHLLAFSRRQAPEVRLVNLNQVISDFEPLLRGLVGRDIELVTTLREGLGYVMADSRQLERVIMNLVVNARDAMPQGGKLLIETSHAESGGDQQACQDGPLQGPSVLLTITDTGTGMDKATLSRLFDPFFTTKAPGKGTGLGLSTVREILKQKGGGIWVESEPGQGTSFKLALPRMAKGDELPPQ
jgi:signal transduction histidine kinase